jgi:hypothetical protein
MIVRHDLIEIERIEQLLLIPDAPSHHRTTPPMFASQRRNHCSAAASIDFCNKIGPKRTCRHAAMMSALRGQADIAVTRRDVGF